VSKTLAPAEYQAIHDFLERRAGIRLGPGIEYLVVSRLSRLMLRFGVTAFAELADRLADHRSMRLQAAVVDAMTTNETFWFRDKTHFRALVDGILGAHRSDRLRIWSAAASTGQEAYTIAICLEDAMCSGRINPGLEYDISGTDISPTALQEARAASYCGISASRGLSDEQRRRYFREQGGCIELLPQYRRRVSFRSFNLLQPFDGLGRFDVVFCRNVLIDFSQERKHEIIRRIGRILTPGGHLFLGSTESMTGHEDLFEMRSLAGGLVYCLRR